MADSTSAPSKLSRTSICWPGGSGSSRKTRSVFSSMLTRPAANAFFSRPKPGMQTPAMTMPPGVQAPTATMPSQVQAPAATMPLAVVQATMVPPAITADKSGNWLGERWGLILTTVLGAILGIESLFVNWMSISHIVAPIDVYESFYRITDFKVLGIGFGVGVVLLILLVATAVVQPGKAVHRAHRHAPEEYLVVTEGTGVWHLDGKEFPAKPNDVLYVEPWVYHGLTNTGEKPLTLTIEEGRRLADAAKKLGRILQTGCQQRSMPVNAYASKLVREGAIGKAQSYLSAMMELLVSRAVLKIRMIRAHSSLLARRLFHFLF